ncbi:hypothetical protein BH09MYX1_BH09MYX1_37070 [soil metagenome]
MSRSPLVLAAAFSAFAFATACSSKPATTTTPDGGVNCASEQTPSLTKIAFGECTSCVAPTLNPPLKCTDSKPIAACCVQVQSPTVELYRATGLNYNSAPAGQTTPDLSCLDAPKVQGTPQTVSVKGFVKLFSTGDDSSGVKIEIFEAGPNGALGKAIGTPFITTDTSLFQEPKPTWSKKCPSEGCTLRAFTYDAVPTETQLIIKTSDAKASQKWAELYDYNIYFANDQVQAGAISYDASAVASTDVNTIASAAGGFTIKADRGVIAGEVHDCGDVRLGGAMVNTDYRPEGDMFYFGDNESDPLPDQSRAPQGLGTSKLGLFGALNYPTGNPIRISAVGQSGGARVLLGTLVVQVYPGAVTALSFRGRRPWQK